MPNNDLDFTIARLGEWRIPSPMSGFRFTVDDERVLYNTGLRSSVLPSTIQPQDMR